MKKFGLLFAVFALLQFSCSKDDDGDDNGYKPDQVFQESQLDGFWRLVSTKDNINDLDGPWDSYPSSLLFELKKGNILNEYDRSQFPIGLKKGSWDYDGKNVLNCTLEDGTRYQLKIISIKEERNLLAEVKVTGKDGSTKTEFGLYYKEIATEDEYYAYFTSGFKVKDINNFRALSAGHNYLTGIKDNKLWIGFFDPDSREQLSEKIDKEDFNLTQTIYKGYGEYETYNINGVYIEELIDEDHMMLTYQLRNEKGSDMNYTLWFANSGKKINYPGMYSIRVRPWYDDSYVVYYDKNMACLTQQGDTIFSGMDSYYDIPKQNTYPVNHNYYVQVSSWSTMISFSMQRLVDDGNTSWQEIPGVNLEAEEYDFIYTVTPGAKTATTWTFQVDVTEYSGKKHSHTVNMDISGAKDWEK